MNLKLQAKTTVLRIAIGSRGHLKVNLQENTGKQILPPSFNTSSKNGSKGQPFPFVIDVSEYL